MKLYEMAIEIGKSRLNYLCNVDSEEMSEQSNRYFLLALNALEQARIWSEMANDESQEKST